ncbi:MAG: outer membrane protein transport protein [Prolixibacteraceae bacterium]|nr:outer membrane protein transport protein [Prolixibacteraceae bacterium]
MMYKNLIAFGLLILLPFAGISQNFVDALRYSSTKIEGTARAGGMGNAFGALGGDFSATVINPAGLGVYRAGEFAVTPSFGKVDINSRYLGTSSNDYRYNFNLSNISYVANIGSGNRSESGLVAINMGVGYNQLVDFKAKALAKTNNAQSSFLDHITENANSRYNTWSDYYEELAWRTDLLIYDEDNDEYWHDMMPYPAIGYPGYGQSQRKFYDYSGAINEYTFAVGLNFSHKFYLGASLGILDVYYKESTYHEEWDAKNEIAYFDDLKFNTSLRTSGTGYNFKVGAIFRPIDMLRLGISINTPTFYSFSDNFYTTMYSTITDEQTAETTKREYGSPVSRYDYRLDSPFKAVFSGAVIISKRGLVSVDCEYMNYGSAKLRDGGDGYAFFNENDDTKALYKAVANLRVGGEYRVTDAFSLRAGYEYYPSAFKDMALEAEQPNSNFSYNVISAGLGYKTAGGFFVDLAYRHIASGNYDMLYPSPYSNFYPKPEFAKFDRNTNKVLLTLGFRF